MKFNILTQAVLAIPFITGAVAVPTSDVSEAKRADCTMTVRYINNWVEGGLDRYRMQLITSPRDDSHLDKYCIAFNGEGVMISNVQCFWDDVYYVDASVPRGGGSRVMIQSSHAGACDQYEQWTGCRTIREF